MAPVVADGWYRAATRREQLPSNDVGHILQETKVEQPPVWMDISDRNKIYWSQWNFQVVSDGVLRCHWESSDGSTETTM
jgi:hypothetical protein